MMLLNKMQGEMANKKPHRFIKNYNHHLTICQQ